MAIPSAFIRDMGRGMRYKRMPKTTLGNWVTLLILLKLPSFHCLWLPSPKLLGLVRMDA